MSETQMGVEGGQEAEAGAARPGTALVPAAETGNGARPPAPAAPSTPAPSAAGAVKSPSDAASAATPVHAPAPEPAVGAPSADSAATAAPETGAPDAGPTPRQARAASVLGSLLGAPFDFGPHGAALGAQGWWLFLWPSLEIGGAARRPALAGWKRERLPELPLDSWPQVAPDWICEIVAGPDEAGGATREAADAQILAGGVQFLWLLDPVTGALAVSEANAGEWMPLGTFYAGETVKAPPFHMTTFPINALWPD